MTVNKLCSAINPSRKIISDLSDDTLVSFIDMQSVSNDGYITNRVNKPLGEFKKTGYTYFAENDIIIAKITPCMENGKCALATELTNGIGMGSSEFHVFRCNEEIVNSKFLFSYLNRESIRKEAEQRMTGSSGHRRVPISFYEKLLIPVPSLYEQKAISDIIDEYNLHIRNAEQKMLNNTIKKQQVLTKYL